MAEKPAGVVAAMTSKLFGQHNTDNEQLLHRHLSATLERYCVVGFLAVAATPLVYTITRVTAPKRRATLVNFATRLEEQWEEEGSGDAPPPPPPAPLAGATGRSPQRAGPRTGSTKVGSVTVSYSGNSGGDDGGHTREPRIYQLGRRYNAYLLPIARSVLRHQRASDPAFGHACAAPTALTFLRNAATQLAQRLVVDAIIHVAVFGLCAYLDTTTTTTTTSDTAVRGGGTPASLGEDPAAPSSAVSAVLGSVWAYGRWLLVDLLHQGLTRGDSDDGEVPARVTAYQLYEFTFSAATPMQACCMPRWTVRLIHICHGLTWLGIPRNPKWAAPATAASVWRSLTPKGYFVYFLLRRLPQHTVRHVAVMAVRHVQCGCYRLVAVAGGGKWSTGSPSASVPESSVLPFRRREESGAGVGETGNQEKKSVPASVRHGPASALVRAAHHVLSPRLTACGLRDMSFAATSYVVASTLALLDSMLAAGKQSNGGLLGFLRSGGGLSFHVMGYLSGVRLFLCRKRPSWAAILGIE